MDLPERTRQTITLNGASVEIHPDETVLQVANRNGIFIPVTMLRPPSELYRPLQGLPRGG